MIYTSLCFYFTYAFVKRKSKLGIYIIIYILQRKGPPILYVIAWMHFKLHFFICIQTQKTSNTSNDTSNASTKRIKASINIQEPTQAIRLSNKTNNLTQHKQDKSQYKQ